MDKDFLKTRAKRQKLADVLPLATPFAVYLYPVNACNFKCKFCVCSLPFERRGLKFDTNVMDLGLFKKCVDDMRGFDGKIRMLRFAGSGEPLLHKDIARMVRYASDSNIAEKTEIITNGSLLTHELSDSLVTAGLTQIRFSIEALDDAGYEEITGTKIRFQDIVDNIAYLYRHKGSMMVNVKIIDYAVAAEPDKQKFYDIFEPISDSLSIERLCRSSSKVDYSGMAHRISGNALRGMDSGDIGICQHPFYMMQVCPDGSVVPCCSLESSPKIANCADESIVDIWRGEKYDAFRRRMLDGVASIGGACAVCTAYKANMFPEDVISSDDAKRLKAVY